MCHVSRADNIPACSVQPRGRGGEGAAMLRLLQDTVQRGQGGDHVTSRQSVRGRHLRPVPPGPRAPADAGQERVS